MKRSAVTLTVALLLSGSVAFAQGKPANDPAAAQALFYEARTLMQQNRYGDACPKLEESLRLDYGIGTEFNLADCHEHIGKIATAWSGFLSVAAASKAKNQIEREKVARERAKKLEPRLPKLVIEVPAPTAGLEVKRDGVLVGNAAWGTPVPVDPGTHRIAAVAPGKQPWETTVQATEGKVAKVSLPRELPNAPVAVVPQAPLPITTTMTAPTPVEEPQPITSFPEPVDERKGSTQRGIGWVASGLGVAGLGVAAGFGLDSLAKRNQARNHCDGDLCDAQGVDLRDRAIRSGNVATISTIAGGAALLGGIVLILTAPSGTERKANEAAKGRLQAVPHVATNGGGLTLQGVLP